MRNGDLVSSLATRCFGLDLPIEGGHRLWSREGPGHRRRPARRYCDRQRLTRGDCRGDLRSRGDGHRFIRPVAEREARPENISTAHQRGYAGIDRQVLRGADGRLASAKEARPRMGDSHQAISRKGVNEWHGQFGFALRIEGHPPAPEENRFEIRPRYGAVIASTPPGLDGLFAKMAFADDLRLRG